MGELTGGLIQMTAHMVRTDAAREMIGWGVAVAVVFALLAICAATDRRRKGRWRYALLFAAMAALGAATVACGARMPRKKVIYCCASGPVSLEMVAARYDIIEVDGAFLKIAER